MDMVASRMSAAVGIAAAVFAASWTAVHAENTYSYKDERPRDRCRHLILVMDEGKLKNVGQARPMEWVGDARKRLDGWIRGLPGPKQADTDIQKQVNGALLTGIGGGLTGTGSQARARSVCNGGIADPEMVKEFGKGVEKYPSCGRVVFMNKTGDRVFACDNRCAEECEKKMSDTDLPKKLQGDFSELKKIYGDGGKNSIGPDGSYYRNIVEAKLDEPLPYGNAITDSFEPRSVTSEISSPDDKGRDLSPNPANIIENMAKGSDAGAEQDDSVWYVNRGLICAKGTCYELGAKDAPESAASFSYGSPPSTWKIQPSTFGTVDKTAVNPPQGSSLGGAVSDAWNWAKNFFGNIFGNW